MPGDVVVTTSWDDGHVKDMTLACLLDRYRLPATFYIAPLNREIRRRERLLPTQVRQLANAFEIGGHTLTHVPLPAVAPSIAEHEIRAGRDALESITGTPVMTFCYPRGAFNHRHTAMVMAAGFILARTVERHSTALPTRPFEVPTTFHAYRHLSDVRAAWVRSGRRPHRAWRHYWNWDDWAVHAFDRVLETGGVYHLWGHSWEIDERGDWRRLERVLAHISDRDGVRYVANAELLGLPVTGGRPCE